MAKYTTIGGQALIEGIMMKNPKKKTALAVRKPDKTIDISFIEEKIFSIYFLLTLIKASSHVTMTTITHLLNVFVVILTQSFFLMKLKKPTHKLSHFFFKFWTMVV